MGKQKKLKSDEPKIFRKLRKWYKFLPDTYVKYINTKVGVDTIDVIVVPEREKTLFEFDMLRMVGNALLDFKKVKPVSCTYYFKGDYYKLKFKANDKQKKR